MTASQRYACGVEYHGGRFAGWQTQAGQRSVEAELQRAVEVVAAHEVPLIAAGRTDAGVHASGQVIHFDSAAARSLHGWTSGINSELPGDISISFLQPVPGHFHARFSAESRSYRYLIFNRRQRSALAEGRANWQLKSLDEQRMQQAAKLLIGQHDFSAFRASQCQSRSPIRRLDALSVERAGHWVTITATANAFLHHMVRNIAGLLIEIGRERQSPDRAAEILARRDRRLSAPTAAAEGLYLASVRYADGFGLPAIDPAAPGHRSVMMVP